MSSRLYRLTWTLFFLVAASIFFSSQGQTWPSVLLGIALLTAPLVCFLGLVKGMDRWHLLDPDQWVAGLAWGGGVAALTAAWLNKMNEFALNEWTVDRLNDISDEASGFSYLVGAILPAPILAETSASSQK